MEIGADITILSPKISVVILNLKNMHITTAVEPCAGFCICGLMLINPVKMYLLLEVQHVEFDLKPSGNRNQDLRAQRNRISGKTPVIWLHVVSVFVLPCFGVGGVCPSGSGHSWPISGRQPSV